MNVLNPKVSLFFLALLPQFVHPSAGQIPQQMLVLGVIFLVQALVVFTLVSIGAEKLRHWLLSNERIARRIHWLKGVLFAVIGIQIAFSERS